jgi:cytochrome c peroxidase
MTKGNCIHCHSTDGDGLGTTGLFSNNGLDEITSKTDFKDLGLGKTTNNSDNNGKFKIPSLRNLLFTAPYMHDGRFKTLEEVIDFYSSGIKISPTIDSKMEFAHQGGSKFTKLEKTKIIAFLKTLSDSSFLKNKQFSSPFSK